MFSGPVKPVCVVVQSLLMLCIAVVMSPWIGCSDMPNRLLALGMRTAGDHYTCRLAGVATHGRPTRKHRDMR